MWRHSYQAFPLKMSNPLPQLKNFKNFVALCHKYLRIADPTQIQFDICDELSSDEELISLQAFRGIGKSHLASLYCLWLGYWNKESKILIVSATSKRAAEFVKFCRDTINLCPFLAHMKPGKSQRDLSYSFDFNACLPSQTPSIEAKGITSQITGSRASVIIADDLEVSINSLSAEAREKLENLSKEFVSILLPGGRTIYLGTPHSSSSIYNRLPEKGYKVCKFPAYDEAGKPTEPLRFPKKNLETRRKLMGDSEFQLQYMLDTSQADKDKYPLKLKDLVVSDKFSHKSCMEEYKISEKTASFRVGEAKGYDCVYESSAKGYEVEYTKRILALDPAGSGADEFAWCVLATRNGYYYVIEHGGWNTGLNQDVLRDIQRLTRQYAVHQVVVETNFGDDLILNMLSPNLRCEVVPVKHTTNKEKRIISTLEPVLNQHKLVVNKHFVQDEVLMTQFCNLAPVKGALKHDDRIDCLAMGIKHLREEGTVNLHAMREKESQDRLEAELESIMGQQSSQSWI